MKPHLSRRWIVLACLAAAPGLAAGEDWPTWRYDAARSAVTPEQLPAKLALQWTRQLPPPAPAWPASQNRLQFDASYEPIIAGQAVFVASMTADRVTAYDLGSGAERWRFYAGGPVRFAPTAHKGKLYVACDDGMLYCLAAETGKLLWKVRGGPAEKKVIGNDRLVGMWPARGAPAVADGVVYFAAGIWPFMGTFLHAVDAESGKSIWVNSGSGSTYISQPHNSPAFAGVAPQGYLAVSGDTLLVPSGRSVPGAYDRRTGALRYFNLAAGKSTGSYAVSVAGKNHVNAGQLYETESGKALLSTDGGFCTAEAVYVPDGKGVSAKGFPLKATESKDRKGNKVRKHVFKPLWQSPLDPAPEKLFCKAGNRLYGGRADGTILAVDLPEKANAKAAVSWRGRVAGKPRAAIAANGRLLVVTAEGGLFCFGAEAGQVRQHATAQAKPPTIGGPWSDRAQTILKGAGADAGYCVALGVGSGGLIEQLVIRSKLHVIAVDPDAAKVDAFRRRMDAMGLYGRRVSACVGDPLSIGLPPYLATLIVSEDTVSAGVGAADADLAKLFAVLRPYGGLAVLPASPVFAEAVVGWAQKAGSPHVQASRVGGLVMLRRAGSLPGSAPWTHNYADAANTVTSRDARVKAPLGLLWFGGPPNDPILPRHGHGPAPQVAGGRLFIEGRNLLRAVDVYTGRLLWERTIRDLGKFHDETGHQPGAGEIGSNYVSLADGIYVITPAECMRLDPATGKTVKTFALPAAGAAPRWGFLTVWDDLLIAAADPIAVSAPKKGEKPRPGQSPIAPAEYSSASRRLVVMDRHSGKVLWQRRAERNFRHNAIAVAAGKVFCLDKMSEAKVEKLKRRGQALPERPALYALDARTGKVVWQTTENVFGTFLNYSAEHDALVQAGSAFRDRAKDEVGKGIAVYRGRDGSVVWKDLDAKYSGPLILHHDTIITNGTGGVGIELLTGKPKMRRDPLTGRAVAWTWSRNYGCNTAVASEHLLTFRSAAAGYYDMTNLGGTGNMGGFKSSCTSNLIVADGVLNAPDYTRTCSCSYQNQASLAMIHMPEVETWTFTSAEWDGSAVRRVGLNLGAPGDRQAESGTFWLDFPSVGGPSPNIPVEVPGDSKPTYFRHHTSLMSGEKLRWVGASGAEDLHQLVVTVARNAPAKPRAFTVRLFFAEPDLGAAPGQRRFDVKLQDKTVLTDLDVLRAAGGPRRTIVKEFKGVGVGEELKIELAAKAGKTILCGVELIAEAP